MLKCGTRTMTDCALKCIDDADVQFHRKCHCLFITQNKSLTHNVFADGLIGYQCKWFYFLWALIHYQHSALSLHWKLIG